MRHGEQLLIVWPGDGQEKPRFNDCFNVVLDRSAKSKEASTLQVVYLPLRFVTDGTLQHLNPACAVCVVFFYPGGSIHANQNNPKVLLFEKGPGVDPFWPGLVMLEFSHFGFQIKVREIGDPRAVIRCKCNRHAAAFLLKIVLSTTASLCSVSFAA